jgi:hypothetical protein
MRAILSCLQSRKRHPIPAYEFWRRNFVEGCREAAIECLEVPGLDWVEGLVHPQGAQSRAWRDRTWETVLAFAHREHAREPIDFFLGYLYPAQIEPQAILELQRLGIPCVNFFCDNVREFRRVPNEFRPFALHWVPEAEALPMYRQANLAHVHAPMPCWLPAELRQPPAVETEPPTFIGSADILRRDLLGRAVQAGADIVVRGAGWSRDLPAESPAGERSRSALTVLSNQWAVLRSQGPRALIHKLEDRLNPLVSPPLPAARIGPAPVGDEYFRITREAAVTIGVNRVPTSRRSNRSPLVYSRLRDLEAPMVGACYLTEWTAGLAELYDLGAEIETYRTPEELAAKVRDLQGDPARRRRMRERAQRRALAEHGAARTLERVARQVTARRTP